MSSTIIDSAFDKLRYLTLDTGGMHLVYSVLGLHRVYGQGGFNSTVTIMTSDGNFFLDGFNVWVDGTLSDALLRSQGIGNGQAAVFGLFRRQLPLFNILTGHFEMNTLHGTDTQRVLYQAVQEIRPTLPSSFRILLKEYHECDTSQGLWQQQWCMNAASTVNHRDFPGHYFFSNTKNGL